MSDGSVSRRSVRNRKFCEGWLEHKAHRPTGYRYEKLYFLLEDNVIYIFTTDSPSEETQLGNLTLDSNTEFTVKGGSPSKGFKFDLNTGSRLNRFKAKKSTERELWRAYIVGVSKGYVPKNLDLLDIDLKRIQQDIAEFHAGDIVDYDPKRSSIASGRSKIDSGVVSLGGRSRLSSSSSSEDARSRTSASAVSSASGTLNHGGPTMVHKFYNDHNREQEPPSWFIPHCSRETAERLLERAISMNYGNTLMRESTSHLSNGSYVISKLTINKKDGSVDYEHFEVIRAARGYRVNVENQHEPMKCLSEVMNYFVRTSGGSTHPLIVNDYKVLGQETPGYATQIYNRTPPDPWKWPPAGSRDEPVPDYDQPNSPPHQSNIRNIDGSQTVSAGILRNRPLPSPGASERKSVGWSSVITTPPPTHFQTFAGSRSRQEPVPSMVEMAQRSNEADQLHKFETMLSGFESGFQRDTIYANDPASQKVTPCPAPPPAPPTPHLPERPRSYVNVNENAVRVDPDLDALPVAPPAPRDPVASTSNTRNSISTASSVGIKSSTSSPAMPVNFRNSSSSGSGLSNTSQTRQNVTKSVSEIQLRNVRSPDSPKNFPTWNTPKQNTNVSNQINKPDVVKQTSVKPEEAEAGIDDKTPGGVSTIRSKFESSASSKQGRARSSMPVRWSVSSGVSETMDELDDLYDYLSDDLRHTSSSSAAPNTNTTNKMHIKSSQSMIINPETNNGSLLAVGRSQSLQSMTNQTRTPEVTHDNRQRHQNEEDDLYDDTAVPGDQQTAERKVQFQQKRQVSFPNPENNRMTSRRQTEPAIPVTQFEGLSQEFKMKLEGMFGGNVVSPTAGQGPRPGSQHVRPISAGEDHIYQELPEVIPPDGVFYANEHYNNDQNNR